MTLPAHLFSSDCDGALYDTRLPEWSKAPPLRAVYKRHFATIENFAQLKATLRDGPYAWPGGYPLYFIAADCEAMSFESVRDSLREIAGAYGPHGDRSWRIVACEINYEDNDLTCAHSGKPIESAYGDDDKAPAVGGASQGIVTHENSGE